MPSTTYYKVALALDMVFFSAFIHRTGSEIGKSLPVNKKPAWKPIQTGMVGQRGSLHVTPSGAAGGDYTGKVVLAPCEAL